MRTKTALAILLAMALVLGVVIQLVEFNFKSDLAKKDQQITQLNHEITGLKFEVVLLRTRVQKLEATIVRGSMTTSWYGPGFHGRKSSDGTIFNQAEFTCAHRTLPFGTVLILAYNGKVVPAIVTDRGPFVSGRDLDVSLSVAQRLGMVREGVVQVTVYQIKFVGVEGEGTS